MLMTVLHSASDTEYTASQEAGLKKLTRVPSMYTIDLFMQLFQELCQEIEESSVHATEFVFTL